ncbi:glycosyltransferase family 4 protein [Chloroflexota bacterium]
MNICLVLISNGWGGGETVVYELARHLRDTGQKVSLILNQEMTRYYANLEDVEVFNIGSLFTPTSSQRYNLSHRAMSLLRAYLRELFGYPHYRRIRKEVTQFISANSVDIVHAHMMQAAFLVSSLEDLKILTVYTNHGEHRLMGTTPVSPLAKPLVRLNAKRYKKALMEMGKITHVCKYSLNSTEKYLDTPSKVNSMVIYNGVNISEIQTSLKSNLNLEGEFNLLFPGGSKWAKGWDLLAPALATIRQEIPSIHAYIALNIPQNDPLRKMVTKLRLEENVTFVGFLPPQEYRSLLNSVDMFVLPSRIEAFPIAHLEAMALGKPIIAGNTGGVPEALKDGINGILVEPDIQQITEAILRLYKNESLRREMSQNNLRDVVKFDWNIIVEKYIEVYRELIGTARTRRG